MGGDTELLGKSAGNRRALAHRIHHPSHRALYERLRGGRCGERAGIGRVDMDAAEARGTAVADRFGGGIGGPGCAWLRRISQLMRFEGPP